MRGVSYEKNVCAELSGAPDRGCAAGGRVLTPSEVLSRRSLKETCTALFTHRNNECLTAVKAFQKDNKLTVDGVVGAKTWAALLNDKTSTSIYKIVIDGLSEEQKNKVKRYLDNEKIVAVVVREV